MTDVRRVTGQPNEISDAKQPGGITAAAERMRRSRQRRRDGFVATVLLEVRKEEVDFLVRRGLLTQAERADRTAIAFAIGEFLDSALG